MDGNWLKRKRWEGIKFTRKEGRTVHASKEILSHSSPLTQSCSHFVSGEHQPQLPTDSLEGIFYVSGHSMPESANRWKPITIVRVAKKGHWASSKPTNLFGFPTQQVKIWCPWNNFFRKIFRGFRNIPETFCGRRAPLFWCLPHRIQIVTWSKGVEFTVFLETVSFITGAKGWRWSKEPHGLKKAFNRLFKWMIKGINWTRIK